VRAGRAGRWVVAASAAAVVAVSACGLPNHHLVHPAAPAADVVTWENDFQRGALRVHVVGARPPGPGPFPAVLVHPEGGKTARDMRGVVWDLAGRGWVALAADYRRLLRGRWRRNVFAWRSPADAVLLLDATRAYPEVDQARIGLLGFSQGGVFSLLIAAHAPDRVRAVVAYYPVTDFPRWFARAHEGSFEAFAWRVVRWWFRRESGAASEDEFATMLRHASAWYVADRILAPVLLLHGARDVVAPVEESRRMAERLAAAGRTAEVVVPDDGVHLFNFRQARPATDAWDATVAWLDRWVVAGPAPGYGAVATEMQLRAAVAMQSERRTFFGDAPVARQ
jgi:dipeptidyl aminopeptidase/acylaminoacyl peptidase